MDTSVALRYTDQKGMRIPGIEPELQRAAETIIRAGFKAYLVGGAVRDRFLGRTTSDYDIATNATPDQCLRLFPHAIPTGIKHGTVTLIPRSRRFKIEITTFRIESDYRDGRHPDTVTFVDDITQDLSRRDFTINAMAIDLENSAFVDPFGGRADIAARVVRAVGRPTERFQEDGLRTLRAIRFASQLEFSIDPATLEAIGECRERLECVSSERIRDEFSKMICSPLPSRALRLLLDTQTIRYVVPELLECVDVRQPERHRHDVFNHLCATADAVSAENLSEERLLVLRLAALFHDIGKPRTIHVSENGELSFHRHEFVSETMAREALVRLKYPNALIDRVCHLVRHHMFNYRSDWSDAAVRRFLARVGLDALEDLFALRLADTIATAGAPLSWPLLAELKSRIERIVKDGEALSLRDLAVNGHDLAEIGIPKGREMGAMLSELLDTVLEDPSLNTREQLIRIAKSKYFHINE